LVFAFDSIIRNVIFILDQLHLYFVYLNGKALNLIVFSFVEDCYYIKTYLLVIHLMIKITYVLFIQCYMMVNHCSIKAKL
jgi:hypothetical protein